MTPTQLLFLRSAASAVLLSILFGNKLKEYLYDSIDKKLKWQLALRVAMSVLLLVSIYTAVKPLPLVLVGVVTNLSPLLTAVLSFFILKKALTTVDAVALVASFTGVLLLITGGEAQPEEVVTNIHEGSMVIPIIALLSVPIILSAVALLSRQLRRLNEYSVTCYVALAMFIGYGAAVLTSGDGLSLLWSFTLFDWIVVIGLGSSSTYVVFCVSRAAQYEEPAKLAVVNYFQSVFSFLLDLVFFGTLFSIQQIAGIIIVLTAFSSKVTVAVRTNYLSK